MLKALPKAPAREAPYFYDSLLAFMRHPFLQNLFQSRLWKFCVVGTSSTVIERSIYLLISHALPAPLWWAAQSTSFLFGVTNGFYWNRRWTFSSGSHAPMKQQYLKFIATNLVGLLLTLLLTIIFFWIYTGRMHPNSDADKHINFLSGLCAIPFVVVWNFTASRLWTFKSPATVRDEDLPIASTR